MRILRYELVSSLLILCVVSHSEHDIDTEKPTATRFSIADMEAEGKD